MTAGPHIELTLPEPERALLSSLIGPWRDLLYVPGPGFTSPLDPDAYRSSLVVVPAVGVPVRLSSLVLPAFGGELSRLRLEPIGRPRGEDLGSFFEPSRTGRVYALHEDRPEGAPLPPERAGWRYEGPTLAARLGSASRVRLLRERGRGAGFSWQADRGLVLTGREGGEHLVLSMVEPSEVALFLAAPGLYRALLEPAPPRPGVTARNLLGYGEWPGDLELTVDLLPVWTPVADPRDPV